MSEFNVSTSGLPNGNKTPSNDKPEIKSVNHEAKSEPTQKGLESSLSAYSQNYLTESEIKDPNSIIVEISIQSPIVVLFGTPSSGKTMALIRLTRYLRETGYNVEPVRDFRPTNSKIYKEECCDKFDYFVESDIAAQGNALLSFMLLNVTKNGNSICQILEAPGEHYFNEAKQNEEFPTYIHSIANNNLSKVWVFFLEKGWKSEGIRSGYAKKITNLFGKVRSKDSIILLCNKADLQSDYIDGDKPMVSKFQRDISQLYPAIFEKLGENKGVLGKMFASKSFKSEFVVFSAGTFTPRQDGGKTFIAGSAYYPAKLWEAISRAVKGRWF